MDKLVLSYYDSCLYESDLSILRSESTWLNDRIITFYFEYLQHEIYDSHDILFIGPEVSQAIKMMDNIDEINSIFLNPLDVNNRLFIIFAVNDNSLDSAGGNHWSLCVYSRPDDSFFHFDSAGTSNIYACTKLFKIIKTCLKLPKEVELKQVNCLQQDNSYDCGIYVLCHTDLVCKTAMKSKSLLDLKKIPYKSVTIKRTEIIEMIKNSGGIK